MIVISKYICNALNAGPKAKVDVEKIMKEEFDATIKTFAYTEKQEETKLKSMLLKAQKLIFSMNNIKKQELTMIQVPFSNELYLTKKAQNKIALIHDLDGLRKQEDELNKKEMEFLKTCKWIIAHNRKMKEYLVTQGIEEEKIFVLELFDYLCKEKKEQTSKEKQKVVKTIAYAGNLVSDKSPFLYQLDEKNMNFELELYGKGITKDINEKMKYKGSFKPEELPNKIDSDLGLVWDGNYDESDEKKTFKNYTRYNNPHKLSCYIASGIPVIVWAKSAVAEFVEKENIGYTIHSIYDINQLNFEDYTTKKENVERLMEQVRNGFYTKRVVKEILLQEKIK